MRRSSVRRLALPALALGLLAPALAACSDEPADLVIYSGRNEDLVEPLLEKLEKELDANVEVRYGDSAELAAQILEEGDKTEAGLFFSQDAGALGALSKEGVLTPFRSRRSTRSKRPTAAARATGSASRAASVSSRTTRARPAPRRTACTN